jgi:hypothetical protein
LFFVGVLLFFFVGRPSYSPTFDILFFFVYCTFFSIIIKLPHSTNIPENRVDQFYWWRKQEYPGSIR